MGTYDGLIRDLDKKEKQEAEDRQTYPFGTPKRVLNERQEAERRKLKLEKKHTDFEKIRWPLPEEAVPANAVESDNPSAGLHPTMNAMLRAYGKSKGTARQCAQVAVDLGFVRFPHEFMLRCVPPEHRRELMEAWAKLEA